MVAAVAVVEVSVRVEVLVLVSVVVLVTEVVVRVVVVAVVVRVVVVALVEVLVVRVVVVALVEVLVAVVVVVAVVLVRVVVVSVVVVNTVVHPTDLCSQHQVRLSSLHQASQCSTPALQSNVSASSISAPQSLSPVAAGAGGDVGGGNAAPSCPGKAPEPTPLTMAVWVAVWASDIAISKRSGQPTPNFVQQKSLSVFDHWAAIRGSHCTSANSRASGGVGNRAGRVAVAGPTRAPSANAAGDNSDAMAMALAAPAAGGANCLLNREQPLPRAGGGIVPVSWGAPGPVRTTLRRGRAPLQA